VTPIGDHLSHQDAAANNRGWADTRGKPVRDKGLERGIVDLLDLKTSEMRNQQPDV
jgi:hypothetical protein